MITNSLYPTELPIAAEATARTKEIRSRTAHFNRLVAARLKDLAGRLASDNIGPCGPSQTTVNSHMIQVLKETVAELQIDFRQATNDLKELRKEIQKKEDQTNG